MIFVETKVRICLLPDPKSRALVPDSDTDPQKWLYVPGYKILESSKKF
jgi:hypothetical protein